MEPKIESFKVASTTASQVITLSSGLLALTVSFSGEFKIGTDVVPTSLKVCWILLIVTIAFALIAMFALVGVIRSEETGKEYKMLSTNIPSVIMMLSFVGALGFLAAAGWVITAESKQKSEQSAKFGQSTQVISSAGGPKLTP